MVSGLLEVAIQKDITRRGIPNVALWSDFGVEWDGTPDI